MKLGLLRMVDGKLTAYMYKWTNPTTGVEGGCGIHPRHYRQGVSLLD